MCSGANAQAILRAHQAQRVRAKRGPMTGSGVIRRSRALRRITLRLNPSYRGWKLAQVVKGTSPESLLHTYHAERHPVAARVLHNTLSAIALRRADERTKALRDTMSELLGMDEPRRRFAAMLSGLDIHYDLGKGNPQLGRRMPDLDLVSANGPLRAFSLLHGARPVLLNLGEPGTFDITPWADRVRLVDAKYFGPWELPALGPVTALTAVLIRPDGYVAWVGDLTELGLADALTTWFGSPTAA
jgi:hypothetical protein